MRHDTRLYNQCEHRQNHRYRRQQPSVSRCHTAVSARNPQYVSCDIISCKGIYGQQIYAALALRYAVEHKYQHGTDKRQEVPVGHSSEAVPYVCCSLSDIIRQTVSPSQHYKQRKDDEQCIRQETRNHRHHIIYGRSLMRRIYHLARKAQHVLLIHKIQEGVAPLQISGIIPTKGQYAGSQNNGNTLEKSTEETFAPDKHIHTHHHTWQQCSYGALRQECPT